MANKETPKGGPAAVAIGEVYKDEGGLEVIPFFVDWHTGEVRFAPVGSGREQSLSMDEFFDRFEHQGVYSGRAEKQKSNEAALAENKRAADKEDVKA